MARVAQSVGRRACGALADFAVSAPGIGRSGIGVDAPYAVVSRDRDRLTLRTCTDKDTALFFKFR